MVRSAHALVLAGASIAAVAALGFLSLQLFRGYRLTRPYPSTISPEAEQRARRALPGLSIVSLRTSDGLTLRGYFAPGRNRGVVIFVHGGGGNRLALLPEASVIAAHGYGVLLFDSRGEGESEGE